jgi:Na+-translocating ferredoxin:NAD+ oxidoreductase RnfA subunit
MVLFFVAATIFNIVLMIGLGLAFVMGIARIVGNNPGVVMPLAIVGLIAAMVLTFLIYGKVMKWVTVKYDLQKHIPQLFKGRKK